MKYTEDQLAVLEDFFLYIDNVERYELCEVFPMDYENLYQPCHCWDPLYKEVMSNFLQWKEEHDATQP